MPTNVPIVPTGDLLRRLAVRKPVSSAHGMQWVLDVDFLRAVNVEPVYSGHLQDQSAVSSQTFNIAYSRTPGVQVLAVIVEIAGSSAADAITVNVTSSGATLIGTGSPALNGTDHIPCPPTNTYRNYVQYMALLDVSGVTANTIQDVSIAWASVTGGKGIWRVNLVEVPLATVDPANTPTTEAGVNGAWPNPPNLLYDGATNVGNGFVRLFDQLDIFRTGNQVHRQIIAGESKTLAMTSVSTSFGSLTYTQVNGAWYPKLYVRARRPYTTATDEPYTWRVRYTTDSATVAGTAQLSVTPAGGSTTNNTLTLPASGVGTWAVATGSVNIPCSGTNQVTAVVFDAKTNAAGQVWVSQSSLISAWT